jgi:NADH dehydrogenase
MKRKTVAVTGPEKLTLSEAIRRVARVTGKRIRLIKAPVAFHYFLARLCEWTMKVPLVAEAQVRILSEGVTEPAMFSDPLPYDLKPTRNFTEEQIRRGLPEPGPFGLNDLLWCAR